MSHELWTAVDQYFSHLLIPPDEALDAALRTSAAAGLPSIHVSSAQGKFLHLLVRIRQARTILEIGTLGGYSAIWMARALPADGRLTTLECDPAHVKIASANIARAGLSHIVEIRLGQALDLLPRLADAHHHFDLVFIDADKPSNPDYFRWALKLSRPGTVIIIDNVVRKGAVIDTASNDPSIQGVQRLHDLIAAEPRVSATTLQTVGSKGYDGFTLAVVK
jgi:predicted O-methyltransferase YrrM